MNSAADRGRGPLRPASAAARRRRDRQIEPSADRRRSARCRAVPRGPERRRSSAGSRTSATKNCAGPTTLLDPSALHAVQHRHRLGGGGGFVEQRRGRDLHPREIAHHRLEVEESFETSLRDLGLIRRVGRVPAGILEHVAEDHARRDAVVVAEAEVRLEQAIARTRSPEDREGIRIRAARRQASAAPPGECAPGSLRR